MAQHQSGYNRQGYDSEIIPLYRLHDQFSLSGAQERAARTAMTTVDMWLYKLRFPRWCSLAMFPNRGVKLNRPGQCIFLILKRYSFERRMEPLETALEFLVVLHTYIVVSRR